MLIRYYIDPAGLPHIYEHHVSEQEVEAVLTADQRKILKALVESKDDKPKDKAEPVKAEPAKEAKK